MKKYVKPELFFERYELSQHIAACDWDLNNATEEACGFKPDPNGSDSWYPAETVLALSQPVCNLEDYCYMNSSSDNYNTFNS